MIDMLVMLALAHRDRNGEHLPDGAIYAIQYAHRDALEDAGFALTDMIWARIREQITEFATERDIDLATGGDLTLARFSPEELTETYLRERTPISDDPRPIRLHAFIGYWLTYWHFVDTATYETLCGAPPGPSRGSNRLDLTTCPECRRLAAAVTT